MIVPQFRSLFMENLTHYPLLLFAVCFVALSIVSAAGSRLRRRSPEIDDEQKEHFGVVLAAILTLLGLIIGFSFAMAVSRYDQRKNLEEAEANAIGTEYLRANLLPADDASRVRELLKRYCDERISNYEARDELRIGQIDTNTAKLQAELWSVVERAAKVQPTPIVGLVVSGMNDVLNAQGYM